MTGNKLPTVGTPAGMRELNQRAVLDRLRVHGPDTRPSIAKGTGLSKPTVGQALLDLEQHGLVRTVGRTLTGPGRAAVLYEADPAAGHVLGIDIGRELIRVAIADLAGTVVTKLDERNRSRSANALVRTVQVGADRALAQAGLRRDDLVATVVGSPGVLDKQSRSFGHVPNLPGWERRGLLDDLEAALGPGLVVENDANLAAIGEYREGVAQGVDTFVCLTVGTGIGMGIVVNGTLFRGAHGAAGEVGYLPYGWPTDGIPDDGYAKPRQGMLEAAAAARSVVEIAAANGVTARSAREVFQLAYDGNDGALRAVREEAGRLAFVVAAVAAVIDPELVVIGGGVGTNTDLLQEPMERMLVQTTPLVPKIVAGELGERAVLAGAIATALRTAQDVVFDRMVRAG
ncbi:MAG TPA: ROK family transcriptional regulator [Pseudonocardiaceae bacterium]|nr:ROK family transcriptional regulator [Pseudonocardiaceae bacterium]